MITINPYGRAGNQVMQTINAVAWAMANGGYLRTNRIEPVLAATHLGFGEAVNGDKESDFYVNDVPDSLTHDMRREVAQKYLSHSLLPRVYHAPEDMLTIHLRSGDTIWNNVNHQSMVQPPMAFYRRVIEDGGFQSIGIICEDNRHPLLSVLAKMDGVCSVVCGGDPANDYAALCGATNLVPAYSTFSTSASFFAPRLQTMWLPDTNIFQYKGKHIALPTFCDVRKYRLDGYTAPETWRASPEQLDLMVNLPDDKVVAVDSFV